MNRWVWVQSASENFDARHHNFLLSWVGCYYTHATSTLTIETEVLSERLEKHNVVKILSEKSKTVCITLKITRSETLISWVEGTEVALGLYDIKNVVPLGWGWVYTCWIVCANVKQNNWVALGILKILTESVKVKSLGGSIIIPVIYPFSSNNFNESSVERPGGVWNKDLGVFVRIPVSKKLQTETERASSRNGLSSSYTTFFQLVAFFTVCESEGLCDERVNSLDSSIFVIHIEL